MGFLDKMKAANGFNLGSVESPDFPACKIVVKGGIPVIISGAANGHTPDYPIVQENVAVFKLIACGACWAKYLIVFKDGKSAYITQEVITDSQKRQMGTSVTMASIERYIKYVDIQQSPSINVPSSRSSGLVPNRTNKQQSQIKASSSAPEFLGDNPTEEVLNFKQSGTARITNPYFGADTKGIFIKLSTDQEVFVVSEEKSNATFNIYFYEGKIKHIVEGIPSFYLKF